ncbi:MAG: class D sortase [Niameybacter sp.]
MKHLAKLMIFLGICLLLLPTLGGLYTQYQQQQMYDAYLQNASGLEQTMNTLNETLSTGLGETTSLDKSQDPLATQTPNGIEVIGLITIPKLDVSLMLVEGVSDQALKFAAGHMPGTALPGEVGNCAIAGHRSYTFGEYFNRIDELEMGDEIHITVGKETYIYQVYESFLVEPTEMSVTEPQGDKKVVTLITCHPVVNATHRLIVRGELVEK